VITQGVVGDVIAIVATELVEANDAIASGTLKLGDPSQVCACKFANIIEF
jgi:hypothetical protein